MELFSENTWRVLAANYFRKNKSILDVWLDSEYVFADIADLYESVVLYCRFSSKSSAK